MKALVKKEARPGLWLEDVPEPVLGINDVVAGAFCLAFAEIVTRSFYKKTQPGKYWDFLNWFKLGLCYALITDAFKLGS